MLGYYLSKAVSYCLLRKPVPLALGLAVTDRCNLSCLHCRVANTMQRSMSLAQIEDALKRYHARGFRDAYITGGEPFLWRDGEQRLDAVIRLARDIGYNHIHVYTNGTVPLESEADRLWIGMDGLKETFTFLRGDYFDTVVRNLRRSSHPHKNIVYVINSVSHSEIKDFLNFASDLPVNGVMFYFHTPYYGKDGLFLSLEERRPILEQLIRYKQEGLPVINSYAGLRMLKSDKWMRPNPSCAMVDTEGEYVCCRTNRPEVCAECGYSAGAELAAIQQLRPSAIQALLRYW